MGEKIDQTQSRPDQAAEASLAVLDRFMMALNSGDEPLLATLHFPHYRLAGDGIQVWDRPGSYLGEDQPPRRDAQEHHGGPGRRPAEPEPLGQREP